MMSMAMCLGIRTSVIGNSSWPSSLYVRHGGAGAWAYLANTSLLKRDLRWPVKKDLSWTDFCLWQGGQSAFRLLASSRPPLLSGTTWSNSTADKSSAQRAHLRCCFSKIC